MSALETFPNAGVDACRESSTQKNTDSSGVVKQPRKIVTRKQGGVMRPEENSQEKDSL